MFVNLMSQKNKTYAGFKLRKDVLALSFVFSYSKPILIHECQESRKKDKTVKTQIKSFRTQQLITVLLVYLYIKKDFPTRKENQ